LFEKQKNNSVFAYFVFINEKVKKLVNEVEPDVNMVKA